jgi:2-polyprenyl-3-methyl-5-hydroxy-6-metoxy-1,4-benzoquinol methylase
MPVNNIRHQEPIYQRRQYERGGIARFYWDYRDKQAISYLDDHDQRVVDIGCGEGVTLEKVARLFPNKIFFGVDTLMENLSICEHHNLKIVGGNVYQLPFCKGSFDCILLFEVIEHLEKPESAVSEIHRVLRAFGKLVIIFPNDRTFKIARILTGKFKEAYYDPGHLRQWTPKDIKNFLNDHGFRILKRKNIPFFVWPISLHHVIVCKKIT